MSTRPLTCPAWRSFSVCGGVLFAMMALTLVSEAATELPPSFMAGTLPTAAWIHRDSGFSFRAKVAGFDRGEAGQFNAEGTDVSVGYNSRNPWVIATVYVYPTGGLTLQQELKRRQVEITTAHPQAELIETGTAMVTPKKISVLQALYLIPKMFPGNSKTMSSILLVGQRGERFVEYRISYPSDGGQTTEEAAKRFYQEFAWP